MDALIKKQNQILSYKKHILPFDMLGRTLSYNTFIPRICYRDDLNNIKKCFEISSCELEKKLSSISISKESNIFTEEMREDFKGFNGVIFNDIDSLITTQDYTNFNILGLDLVSILRRLTPFFIIYKSVIVDRYQILEAVIFGADGIILDSDHLDRDKLNELVQFSYSLGIMPIFQAKEKDDLKKLFYLKVPLRAIYVQKDLIKLLPNSYYILCDHREDGVDCIVEKADNYSFESLDSK